jgi:hypothetical protein
MALRLGHFTRLLLLAACSASRRRMSISYLIGATLAGSNGGISGTGSPMALSTLRQACNSQ